MSPRPSYRPEIHHRRSIRLQGYDYSQSGRYFITILCKNRACLFGQIVKEDKPGTYEKTYRLELTPGGQVAEKCWREIPDHFPRVILHDFVIMPNHIHGIIELTGTIDKTNRRNRSSFENEERTLFPLQSPSKTIGSIVRGFKIGVTKWFRQHTLNESIWHRNYYEHIVRNEYAFHRITEYIRNNPSKWIEDRFYSN